MPITRGTRHRTTGGGGGGGGGGGLRRRRRSAVRERDELVLRSVEDILVAREVDAAGSSTARTRSCSNRREAGRRLAPAGDPERVGRAEARVVAGARLPPVRRRVDDRPAAGQRLVLGDEARQPGDHRALAQAVAGRAVRVVLDVERAGQRLAVGGPRAAVRREPVRLRGAGRAVGQAEVVRAADEPDVVRAVVLLREVRVDVARPLGRLDVGEPRAVRGHRRPVDVALPTAHVEPRQARGPSRPLRRNVAHRQARPGVVALRVRQGASGSECRSRRRQAGRERRQHDTIQTHRATLTTTC